MPASEDAGGLKAVALSKLKAQLEEVQQHNTALSSENDTLKDKCAVLQQACDEQLAKQSALQLAHRQQVAELEDAVHSLKQQLADACSNAEEQQAQVAAAREEVHAVLAGREQRCKDLRAEVSVLQKQLAAKGGEADSLSRRLSAINNLTTAFEQELEGLQQGMRRLQERVAQQDASLKQHEKRVLDAVHVGEGLAEQLDKQGAVLEATKQQLQEQQAANRAAEQDHANTRQQQEQELQQAQQELQECKDEVAALEVQLQHAHSSNEDLAEQHKLQLRVLGDQLLQSAADQAAAEALASAITEAAQDTAASAAAQTAALEAERNAAVVSLVVMHDVQANMSQHAAAAISKANAASAAANTATAQAAAAVAELKAAQEAVAAANARAEAAEEAEAVARAEAAAAATAAATARTAAAAAAAHSRKHESPTSELQALSAAAAAHIATSPGAAAPTDAAEEPAEQAEAPTAAHAAAGSSSSQLPGQQQQQQHQQKQQQHLDDTPHHPQSSTKRPRTPHTTAELHAGHQPRQTPAAAAAAAAGHAAPGSASAMTTPAAPTPDTFRPDSDDTEGPPAVRRCLRADSAEVPCMPITPSQQQMQQEQQQEQQEQQQQLQALPGSRAACGVQPASLSPGSEDAPPAAGAAGPPATLAGAAAVVAEGTMGAWPGAGVDRQQQQQELHRPTTKQPGAAPSAVSALSCLAYPLAGQQQQQLQQQPSNTFVPTFSTGAFLSSSNNSTHGNSSSVASARNPNSFSTAPRPSDMGTNWHPAGPHQPGLGCQQQASLRQVGLNSSGAVLMPRFVPARQVLQQEQQYRLQQQQQVWQQPHSQHQHPAQQLHPQPPQQQKHFSPSALCPPDGSQYQATRAASYRAPVAAAASGSSSIHTPAGLQQPGHKQQLSKQQTSTAFAAPMKATEAAGVGLCVPGAGSSTACQGPSTAGAPESTSAGRNARAESAAAAATSTGTSATAAAAKSLQTAGHQPPSPAVRPAVTATGLAAAAAAGMPEPMQSAAATVLPAAGLPQEQHCPSGSLDLVGGSAGRTNTSAQPSHTTQHDAAAAAQACTAPPEDAAAMAQPLSSAVAEEAAAASRNTAAQQGVAQQQQQPGGGGSKQAQQLPASVQSVVPVAAAAQGAQPQAAQSTMGMLFCAMADEDESDED